MNVTIVNPTAASNLRVHPADTATPLASNLNWVAGQSPTPNKVDVKLSDGGAVRLFNQNGTVDVVGDVVGYYTDSSLVELAELAGTPGPQGPVGPQRPAGADGRQGPQGETGPAGRQHGNRIAWTATPDGGSTWDSDPSITFGVDRNPIIAYCDASDHELRVTHCDDPTCTSGTNSAPATALDPDIIGTGAHPSIMIGVDGNPIIAHFDATRSNLRVTHRGDAACAEATTSTPNPLGETGRLGVEPSIAIGVDGLPIIAHRDADATDLRVEHCADVACSTATTSRPDPVVPGGDHDRGRRAAGHRSLRPRG